MKDSFAAIEKEKNAGREKARERILRLESKTETLL